MSSAGWRRCCNCERWFRAQPRNAYHQRFCSSPECQAASKRASQEKWRRKNPDYFHDKEFVRKVQAWRRTHPGYWRVMGAVKDCGPPDALQALLTAQGYANEDLEVYRACLSKEMTRLLQDVLAVQQPTPMAFATG